MVVLLDESIEATLYRSSLRGREFARTRAGVVCCHEVSGLR